MGLIDELKDFRDKMGGNYVSVTVMGGGENVTIYLKKDEEPQLEIKETKKADKAEPVEATGTKGYKRICKRCGKEFTAETPAVQLCPDCKKQSHRDAMKKYNAKRRQEKPVADDIASTVHDLMSLED